MSFTNMYYKRAVGTPKACYVCHKPTTTVLATINTVDFLYSCDSHLSDPGFASQVGTSNDGVGAGAAQKMGLSPEEIAKVKAEWEERQKKKKNEKAKEKEKEKDADKDKDAKDTDDKEKKDTKKVPGSISPPSTTPTPTPPTPTHQRYTLHRDMFALRLAEHRRRRQTVQAKELAPRLPGAPMTMPKLPPA